VGKVPFRHGRLDGPRSHNPDGWFVKTVETVKGTSGGRDFTSLKHGVSKGTRRTGFGKDAPNRSGTDEEGPDETVSIRLSWLWGNRQRGCRLSKFESEFECRLGN
jgi:hypothetical protein